MALSLMGEITSDGGNRCCGVGRVKTGVVYVPNSREGALGRAVVFESHDDLAAPRQSHEGRGIGSYSLCWRTRVSFTPRGCRSGRAFGCLGSSAAGLGHAAVVSYPRVSGRSFGTARLASVA